MNINKKDMIEELNLLIEETQDFIKWTKEDKDLPQKDKENMVTVNYYRIDVLKTIIDSLE